MNLQKIADTIREINKFREIYNRTSTGRLTALILIIETDSDVYTHGDTSGKGPSTRTGAFKLIIKNEGHSNTTVVEALGDTIEEAADEISKYDRWITFIKKFHTEFDEFSTRTQQTVNGLKRIKL